MASQLVQTVVALTLVLSFGAAARQDVWPPAGVIPAGPEITTPRLVSEVKPRYTEEAMRARIQGTVTLLVVVERDGTVGPVRIERSLDAQFGLDEAAIAALKQWRFTPGQKDGNAVRVAVSVEMKFTLRDGPPPAPPAMVWPDAFPIIEKAPEGTWRDDSVDFENLRVQIAYPEAWRIRKNQRAGEVVALQNSDGTLAVTIVATGTAVARAEPLDETKLRDFAEYMKTRTAVRGDVASAAVGQARAGSRLWLWHEAKIPKVDLSKMPPAARDMADGRIGGVTMWTFITPAPPHAFTVMCSVLHPPGIPESAVSEQQRDAAAIFATILQRLSIGAR